MPPDAPKDELIATVSHELRTPLTSIKGALALATVLGRGQLPANVEELLEVAHRNAERLAALVDDLLDIERLEAGALQPKLESCTLDALLERAIADNAIYAAAFGVAYALEIEPDLPPVSLDPARFLQVMANLLSNAAKFSGRSTTVEIRATRMGASVAVAVRDRGPGIPEQLKARLYEKFARLDLVTRNDRGGTGLGLNITRRLVHLMGGEIACASKPGEGATFTVTFPADGHTAAHQAVA